MNHDDTDAMRLFGDVLAAFRTSRGLNQKELARLAGFSFSQLGKVEIGQRRATPELAGACDKALGLRHVLSRLQAMMARPAGMHDSDWFAIWREVEERATVLRYWEHSVVPGLVQTTDYAKAILGVELDVTDEQLAQRAEWRRLRREVTTRPQGGPDVLVLLDEAVLHRPVGGGAVMHDQLAYLLELSTKPGVTIRILPASAGEHCAMGGAFAVAEGDLPAIYYETVMRGYIGTDPQDVLSAVRRFDRAGAEALSRSASRQVIEQRAREYANADQ